MSQSTRTRVSALLLVWPLMTGPLPAAAQEHAASTSFAIASSGPCCGPLLPKALALLKLLDASDVENLWLPQRHVDWLSGVSDMPEGYQGKETKTHCSAFTAAMSVRLGVYMLRPPEHPTELLASAQSIWFESPSAHASGWWQVENAPQAQALANSGRLVVAAFKSPDRRTPGHIGIVRPDAKRSAQAVQDHGVQMTQAGSVNALRIGAKEAFRHHAGAWPDAVRYFAHDLPEALPTESAVGR